MSRTEVYAIRKNGEVTLFKENPNSFRWSPVVWTELEERHLPPFRPSFIPDDIPDSLIESYAGHKPMRHGPEDLKEVWNLFHTDKLSVAERWVLGSTYDNVIVLKEDFPSLIEAYRSFFNEENGSSLLELADIYEEMKEDEEIIGIAWSISQIQNPWMSVEWVDSTHPEYDEWEADEDGDSPIEVPYNITYKDNPKHWVLSKKIVEEEYVQK